ncbi:uncharacterized protein GGS22DRAFT_186780 [Annulohypoxylon maeteangense]|uniref:uncharacterized protein n=1 Tax=Annulohypoxylon maeteangense TaxID=1927788 RepID=UPI0020079481|nr:uncharacterized protein GGS22DRAFT_186780 [Annulohypoxylon maeteangense]KAI0886706.1 hypothetical protein GGS22DRAFT_186780 [Annulohypoxylon maeteangense]
MSRQGTLKEPRLQCDKCSYKAKKTTGNLLNHIYYNHIGTQCSWPGCDVQTPSETAMRAHLRRVHCDADVHVAEEGDRTIVRFKCTWPECGKIHVQHSNAIRCCNFHAYHANKRREAQEGNQPGQIENSVEDEAHNEAEVEEDHKMEDEGEKKAKDIPEDAGESNSHREPDNDPDHGLEPELEPDAGEGEREQDSEVTRMLKSISAKIVQHHAEYSTKLDNLSRRVDSLEVAIRSATSEEGPVPKKAKLG